MPAKEQTKTTKVVVEKQIDEFLKILRLLVDFDEKTGRVERQPNKFAHYARKALSLAPPEELVITLEKKDQISVYWVCIVLKVPNLTIKAEWVHEDGIAAERIEHGENPEHPVHSIVCMTDIYEANR